MASFEMLRLVLRVSSSLASLWTRASSTSFVSDQSPSPFRSFLNRLQLPG